MTTRDPHHAAASSESADTDHVRSARVGRREALVGAAAGAGLLATGGVAAAARSLSGGSTSGMGATGPSAAAATSQATTASVAAAGLSPMVEGDALAALFGPIQPGSELDLWTVDAIYQPRAGAIPVVMQTPNGVKFAIEIFRADPDLPAIAEAGPLGLYLSNRGRGGAASNESHGLGLMALARALEGRIRSGAPVPTGLGTLGDRLRDDPRGSFAVPLA